MATHCYSRSTNIEIPKATKWISAPEGITPMDPAGYCPQYDALKTLNQCLNYIGGKNELGFNIMGEDFTQPGTQSKISDRSSEQAGGPTIQP